MVERQQAQRRTAEAERNFAAALGAGASLVDTANAHLADGGMSRDVARSLLQDAEANLGGLMEAGADAGPRLRDVQVQLLAGFSKVQLALCDSAGARARAAKAVEAAAAALTTTSSAPRKLALVRALDALGQAAYADGDRPAAAAAYRRAEQVGSDGTPAGDDAIRSVRRGLAAVIARTDRAAGLQTFRDDLAWQEQAAAVHPDEPAILGQLASDLGRIAELTLASKQLVDTEAALEREAATLQHLAAMQPANMEWQHRLAQNAIAVSRLSAARGDAASAKTQAQAAAQSAAHVSAHDPDNAYWQRDVMNAQLNLYDLYAAARDYKRMVEAMGPALAFVDKLTTPQAGRSCQSGAASLFQLFGRGLLSSAVTSHGLDPTEHPAADALEKSLAIRQAIATAAPDDRAAQFSLADAHVWLARSYLVANRAEAAVAQYQAALAQMQRLLEGGDGSPEWAELMASLSSEYGGFQALQGQTTEALAIQETIHAAAEQMATARPEAARWQHVVNASEQQIVKIKAAQRRVPTDSP